jgi:hypothetical protein
MRTEEINYLDGEFVVNEEEPSTIQELTDLIGDGAVVDETNSNLRYRNKYPRVYALVSKAIVERGFAKAEKERKQVGKEGSKTEKIIYISDMDHIRSFLQQDEATNRPILQELFDSIAPAQPLYVKGERTGGGGKISQAALDSANEFFAKGVETVESVATQIEALVPGFKLTRDTDGNATPESLARGIQALERHLKRQAAAQTKAALSQAVAGVQA